MNEIFSPHAPRPSGPDGRPVPYLDGPFKLAICVTQTCNMDCQLCYADCGSEKEPELNTAQWKSFIDEFAEAGFLHIFFEGGEPFDRPDFEDILAHCSRRLYVAIRTHAVGIDKARAARLKEMGVGRLYVDLFSAVAKTQDELTGTPGSYERSVAGMRNALAEGIGVTILGILSRKNHEHLQAYIELARDIGADQVGILRLYPLGRARQNWRELSLSLEEMTCALASIEVPKGIQLMQSWHPKDGNCCWQNAAVSPTGQSIGCPYLREYVDFGNITDMSFLETWDDPLYRSLRSCDVEDTCPDCGSWFRTHWGFTDEASMQAMHKLCSGDYESATIAQIDLMEFVAGNFEQHVLIASSVAAG